MPSVENKKILADDLKGKAITGGTWLLLTRLLHSVLQFIRTVILARLLVPHDFGLFSVAILALFLVQQFSNLGFTSALIQKKGNIAPYLNTVWTINIIKGAAIALLLFLTAPLLGTFFESVEAISVIRAMALIVVLQSLSNVAVVYFDKELTYKKYLFFTIGRTLAELIVGVSAAILLQNVWALVLGLLAGELTACIISYAIYSFRPRFALDTSMAKELFVFGKWLFGSSALVYLTTQGSSIFVGKYLGLATLGIFHMAYRFTGMISNELVFPVLKVTFPVYARLQDDLPRLRNACLDVFKLSSFIIFLAAMLLFVLADNIVFTVIGEQWAGSIPIIRILVLQASDWSLQRLLLPIPKALGHPRIQTINSFVQLLAISLCIYPLASQWGITGVAWGVVLQNFISFPILLTMVLPQINLSIKAFLMTLAGPLVNALLCGFLLFKIDGLLSFSMTTLCGELLLGVIMYLASSLLFCPGILKSLLSLKNSYRPVGDCSDDA